MTVLSGVPPAMTEPLLDVRGLKKHFPIARGFFQSIV